MRRWLRFFVFIVLSFVIVVFKVWMRFDGFIVFLWIEMLSEYCFLGFLKWKMCGLFCFFEEFCFFGVGEVVVLVCRFVCLSFLRVICFKRVICFFLFVV